MTDLVSADHADPSGDEGISLQYCHQLRIVSLQMPHELLQANTLALSAIKHRIAL